MVPVVSTLADELLRAAEDGAVVDRAVYTVGDAAHFLGVVALVNSLRLTGWDEEIVLVDCGMTEWQRELVGRETHVLRAPATTAPHLLKVVGPLTRPARTMAVIDADIVVVSPLLAEAAAAGRLVAVADALGDRFDERWGDALGLGPLRRRTYVNSGFLIAPLDLGLHVFRELERLQDRIDVRRSMIGSGTPADLFYFLDQDALNALLGSSRIADDDLHVLPYEAFPHPPFDGIVVTDAESLRLSCSHGAQPYGLHHIQRKPWLHHLPPTPYSQLLPRLWLADDLPLRLDAARVPLRFRPGPAGALASRYASQRIRLADARRAVGIRRRSRMTEADDGTR
jgi:hypothetical protein